MRSGNALNVLISPCAFKGSHGPFEVAHALSRGILRAYPDFSTHILPIADGGDGTLEVLSVPLNARPRFSKVFDPLMRPVKAEWALTADGTTAISEMAGASGLKLLEKRERNPLVTSSFGTGQLIREAVGQGARRIILGVGGSATVDGGVGALSALGYRFLDRRGSPLPPGGGSLTRLDRIDDSCVVPALRGMQIEIACDVKNPLCGLQGAARVFGPQKGAGPREVKILEAGLRRLAQVIRRCSGRSVIHVVSGGAAGGLAAGFQGLGVARLVNGFDLIAKATHLERWIRWADLIVTGEGSLDEQSFSGKALGGLVRLARHHNVPVVALAPFVDLPSGFERRFPGLETIPIPRKKGLVNMKELENADNIYISFNLNK